MLYNPRIKEGKRINQQAQLIDVMPTILNLLDIKFQKKIHGNSLLPAIIGTAEDFNKYAFSTKGFEEVAVRTNEWKLIFRSNSSHELYNLVLDPKESSNLIKERSDKFLELRGKFFEWAKSLGLTPMDAKSNKPLEEELRRLGYIA